MRQHPHLPRRSTCAVVYAMALVMEGAGCAAERDPNVYTIMNSGTDEPYHTWDQEVMDECGARSGVEVSQLSVPADQLVPKALRMASSNSLPDVVSLDGSDLPQFADAGGLVPLEELGLSTEDGVYQFLPWLWSNGGDERELASPESVEALEYVVSLIEKGLVSPSVVNWTQADGTSVAPIGGETYTVPVNADDPDRERVAAELVACLTTPEAQLDWSTKGSNVPVDPEAAEQYREDVPELAPFVDQVNIARSRTEHVGIEWNTYSQAIGTALHAALTGAASPQAAMERAQTQVEAELESGS